MTRNAYGFWTQRKGRASAWRGGGPGRALENAKAKREGRSVEEVAAESQATIPLGRYGRPEEYADVVTLLASERAAYNAGSVIRVDGGMTTSI